MKRFTFPSQATLEDWLDTETVSSPDDDIITGEGREDWQVYDDGHEFWAIVVESQEELDLINAGEPLPPMETQGS